MAAGFHFVYNLSVYFEFLFKTISIRLVGVFCIWCDWHSKANGFKLRKLSRDSIGYSKSCQPHQFYFWTFYGCQLQKGSACDLKVQGQSLGTK